MHIPKNFVYNRLDHMGYLDCVDVLECVVYPKKLWVEGIISDEYARGPSFERGRRDKLWVFIGA
jgi:hypothetical protein